MKFKQSFKLLTLILLASGIAMTSSAATERPRDVQLKQAPQLKSVSPPVEVAKGKTLYCGTTAYGSLQVVTSDPIVTAQDKDKFEEYCKGMKGFISEKKPVAQPVLQTPSAEEAAPTLTTAGLKKKCRNALLYCAKHNPSKEACKSNYDKCIKNNKSAF